ncbi:MAG: type II toxin-antitoxin system MqsR family toxin [Dissulfurispiraceae bacterium]
MEKRKPHCDLKTLKKFFNSETTRIITQVARQGAATLGYMDDAAIAEVIERLCSQHFYKSMTMHKNNKIWQDVYKCKDDENKLYIKLQLSVNEKQTILIQFKQDEEGDK